MKSKIVPLLVGLMLSTIMFGQKAESPLKIILKLDDFPAHLETSTKVLDYLFEKDIKAGLGVIAANLNDSSTNILRHYLNLKSKDKTNLFEIWHHGLYHEKFPDFTYEEQKARFEKGDSIVKARLGIQMHAFGAPGNSSDSNTARVVSENPNYHVLMFVSANAPAESKIMKLNNRVNMENGTGKPEFDFFVENYNKAIAKQMSLMVLQGHPHMYNTQEKMEQFKKILQFLIDQNASFITPEDYYLETRK